MEQVSGGDLDVSDLRAPVLRVGDLVGTRGEALLLRRQDRFVGTGEQIVVCVDPAPGLGRSRSGQAGDMRVSWSNSGQGFSSRISGRTGGELDAAEGYISRSTGHYLCITSGEGWSGTGYGSCNICTGGSSTIFTVFRRSGTVYISLGDIRESRGTSDQAVT